MCDSSASQTLQLPNPAPIDPMPLDMPPPKLPPTGEHEHCSKLDTTTRGSSIITAMIQTIRVVSFYCSSGGHDSDSPIPPKESLPNPRFMGKSPWPKSRSIPPIPDRYMSSCMRERWRRSSGVKGLMTSLLFTTLCARNHTNMAHFRFKANVAVKHLLTRLLCNSIKHHIRATTPLPVLLLPTALSFLLPALTLPAWKCTLCLPSAPFTDPQSGKEQRFSKLLMQFSAISRVGAIRLFMGEGLCRRLVNI